MVKFWTTRWVASLISLDTVLDCSPDPGWYESGFFIWHFKLKMKAGWGAGGRLRCYNSDNMMIVLQCCVLGKINNLQQLRNASTLSHFGFKWETAGDVEMKQAAAVRLSFTIHTQNMRLPSNYSVSTGFYFMFCRQVLCNRFSPTLWLSWFNVVFLRGHKLILLISIS